MDTVKFFFSLKISMDWLSRRLPWACFQPVFADVIRTPCHNFLTKYAVCCDQIQGFSIKKRRHSGQMSLKMTGVVGQSDALIYSHPIDHSNDRYRERFFSSRNGFGKKNISGATKVYIFLANERACFVSRPNGEHKNPIFFDFVVNISPPKVNNTGCSIKHHSFCNYFCLQHP